MNADGQDNSGALDKLRLFVPLLVVSFPAAVRGERATFGQEPARPEINRSQRIILSFSFGRSRASAGPTVIPSVFPGRVELGLSAGTDEIYSALSQAGDVKNVAVDSRGQG